MSAEFDDEANINPFERQNRNIAQRAPIRPQDFSVATLWSNAAEFGRNMTVLSAVKFAGLAFIFFTVLVYMSKTVSSDSSEVEVEVLNPHYIQSPANRPVESPYATGKPTISTTSMYPTMSNNGQNLNDEENEDDESLDDDDENIEEEIDDDEVNVEEDADAQEETNVNNEFVKQSLASYLKARTFVAVGDSLTKGKYVHNDVVKTHPYTKALALFFRSANTTILERGSHGETSDKLASRIASVGAEVVNKTTSGGSGSGSAENGGGVFGVFTGSRDLLKKVSAKTILQRIISVHKKIHSFSSSGSTNSGFYYTLAFELPQEKLTAEWEQERQRLNRGIAAFQASCSSRVALVDLSALYNQSLASNARYWSDDFIHLSAIGYDGVGTRVYGAMTRFNINSDPFTAKCDYDSDIISP